MSDTGDHQAAKGFVAQFWEQAACGERYATGEDEVAQFETQSRIRYEIDRWNWEFARFSEGQGLDVLEVGTGMGADHAQWALARPKRLCGVDLTRRGCELTWRRCRLLGLDSLIVNADAESLPFPDASFDLVYSWGVLHHSPDTEACIANVHRVLRTGGTARIMMYHKHSITCLLLWMRYALLRGRPCGLDKVVGEYLESPGTKAYTRRQVDHMFTNFLSHGTRVALGPGDLLQGAVGERHKGPLLRMAKRLWPRWFIERCLPRFGLRILIEAVK